MAGPKLLGIPYDARSSYRRGPAAAPTTVRRFLHSGSANWSTELGAELSPELGRWSDLGDVAVDSDDPEVVLTAVEAAVAAAIADGSRLVSVGGDHFVTWPIMRAFADRHADITILHVDAHPDLYDELDGDRYSHACPFARIMEESLAARLVQVGIRTMTRHQQEQADRFGVEVHEMRRWDGRLPELDGPVYVSIDVDGLDPAYAPGVSHHEPGGLTTRQLLGLLHELASRDHAVIGADVVEINPDRDVEDMTSAVGAKLVRELLGLMLDP